MQPNNYSLIQVETLDRGYLLIQICQILHINIFKGWVRFTTQYKKEPIQKHRVTHHYYRANKYWLDGIKTVKQGVIVSK